MEASVRLDHQLVAVEAEREFRADLQEFPQNGWSLFGLAAALRAQQRDEAAFAGAGDRYLPVALLATE